MTRVADSSWLYAILDGTDAHHDAALTGGAKHAKIHVPPAVLFETLALVQLRAPNGLAQARQALAAMSAHPSLVLSDPPHDHETTARIWDAHTKLSYVDAAAVAAARRMGVDLLTFDKDQAKAHRSGRP